MFFIRPETQIKNLTLTFSSHTPIKQCAPFRWTQLWQQVSDISLLPLAVCSCLYFHSSLTLTKVLVHQHPPQNHLCCWFHSLGVSEELMHCEAVRSNYCILALDHTAVHLAEVQCSLNSQHRKFYHNSCNEKLVSKLQSTKKPYTTNSNGYQDILHFPARC